MDKKVTRRWCHNPRCGLPFRRIRMNQKHCDSYCKDMCLTCKAKYKARKNERARALRLVRSGSLMEVEHGS